jgi:hypothetical protein
MISRQVSSASSSNAGKRQGHEGWPREIAVSGKFVTFVDPLTWVAGDRSDLAPYLEGDFSLEAFHGIHCGKILVVLPREVEQLVFIWYRATFSVTVPAYLLQLESPRCRTASALQAGRWTRRQWRR